MRLDNSTEYHVLSRYRCAAETSPSKKVTESHQEEVGLNQVMKETGTSWVKHRDQEALARENMEVKEWNGQETTDLL